MELTRYLHLLRKWSWLLAVSAILAAGSSYLYSTQATPLYRTTAAVMVGQFLNSDNPQAGDFTISQQLAQYYSQVVRRQSVLQGAVSSLNLNMRWDQLAAQVNAVAPTGSQTIYITVLDGDPRRVKAIADEIARQLILASPTPREREQDQQRQFVERQMASLQERITAGQAQIEGLREELGREVSAVRVKDLEAQVQTLEERTNSWRTLYQNFASSLRGSRTNYLTLTEPAYIPSAPASPTTTLNMLLAALAGAVLAGVTVLVIEYFEDRPGSVEELETAAGLPALGSIPKLPKFEDGADALVVLKDPATPAAEAYGALRAALGPVLVEHSTSTVLVTSAEAGEGKSVIAANLAASYARAGRRTVLVDADLRNPDLHNLLGVSNRGGLADLLRRKWRGPSGRPSGQSVGDPALEGMAKERGLAGPVKAALVPTALPGLRFLPAGHAVAAGDLLASASLDRVLPVIRGLAEVVVIDCPPLLPYADTSILAGKGGVVVLVLDMAKTRSRVARLAREQLARARTTVAGAVINRAPERAGYRYLQGDSQVAGAGIPASRPTSTIGASLRGSRVAGLFRRSLGSLASLRARRPQADPRPGGEIGS